MIKGVKVRPLPQLDPMGGLMGLPTTRPSTLETLDRLGEG